MLQHWDAELNSIKSELDEVLKSLVKQNTQTPRALIEKQHQIAQEHQELKNQLEKAIALQSRLKIIGMRARPLLYWSTQAAKKLQDLYTSVNQLLTKALWVKFVSTHSENPEGQSNILLEDDHLINVAIRREQVLKSERIIEKELEELESRAIKLDLKEARVNIAYENRYASGSCQGRITPRFSDAENSYVVRFMTEFFLTAAWMVQESGVNPRNRAEEKRRRTIENCRNKILNLTNSIAKGHQDYETHINETIQEMQTSLPAPRPIPDANIKILGQHI